MKNADLAKRVCDLIRKCDHERSFLPVELSSLQTILKDELNNPWLFRLLSKVVEECAVLPPGIDAMDVFPEPQTSTLDEIQEEKADLSRRTAILQHHMSRLRKNQLKTDNTQQVQVYTSQINRNRLMSCEESVNKLLSASVNFAKDLNVDLCSFIEKATRYLADFKVESHLSDIDEMCHKIAVLSLLKNCTVEEIASRENARTVCILNQMDIHLRKVELVLCSFLLTLQESHASRTAELKHMANECDGHRVLSFGITSTATATASQAVAGTTVTATTMDEKRRKVTEAVKAKRLLDPVTKRPQIANVDELDRELSWWRSFWTTRQMHSKVNSRAEQE